MASGHPQSANNGRQPSKTDALQASPAATGSSVQSSQQPSGDAALNVRDLTVALPRAESSWQTVPSRKRNRTKYAAAEEVSNEAVAAVIAEHRALKKAKLEAKQRASLNMVVHPGSEKQPSYDDKANLRPRIQEGLGIPERSTSPKNAAQTHSQRKRRRPQVSDIEMMQAMLIGDESFAEAKAKSEHFEDERGAKRARNTATQDRIAAMTVHPNSTYKPGVPATNPFQSRSFENIGIKSSARRLKKWLKVAIQVDGLDTIGGVFEHPAGCTVKIRFDVSEPSQPSLTLLFHIDRHKQDQEPSKDLNSVHRFQIQLKANEVFGDSQESRKYMVQTWNHTVVDLDQEPAQKSPEQTRLWDLTLQATRNCPESCRKNHIFAITMTVNSSIVLEGPLPALEDIEDPNLRSTVGRLTDKEYSPIYITLWFRRPLPMVDEGCLQHFRRAIESRPLPLS